jgi:hypothetical protein
MPYRSTAFTLVLAFAFACVGGVQASSGNWLMAAVNAAAVVWFLIVDVPIRLADDDRRRAARKADA